MSQKDVPENILKLLDVVEDDVFIYLILELVDGGDFFSFIQNSHKTIETLDKSNELTDEQRELNINYWENRVRPIFNDVIQSISWMHSKHICHLDISLENALIDKSKDIIKIIDFGLAKKVSIKDYTVEIDSTKLKIKNQNQQNQQKQQKQQRNSNEEKINASQNIGGNNGNDNNNNSNNNENNWKRKRNLSEKYAKWNDILIRNQENVSMGPKRIGKLRCMAPEVFNLKQFNPFKADTWSIGVMLFMMMLGIPPWNSPDESETIFRMIKAGRIRDVIIYNQRRHLISNQALDLLIRLFKPQSERIHLDFVKLHPFCFVFEKPQNNDNANIHEKKDDS